MIALPPFEVGALQVTSADPFNGVATPIIGALGTVNGVTGAPALAGDDEPIALIATTLTV